MFLPLDKKPDWHNPPLITLLLVIINIAFFYIWQYNDARYEREAFNFYYNSGLVQTELKAYLTYMHQPDRLSAQDIERVTHTASGVIKQMLQDADFQAKLHNDEIIHKGAEDYDIWRSTRSIFVSMREKSVTEKYGLNPSRPTALTMLTNLFLHGNAGHLWMNMLMLVVLGFGVELLLGRWLFLLGYILAGTGGSLLYILFNHGSTIHSIGASGAITGILGMYVTLYGLRKINFFYFLFIYFDFIKARAIWIIPLYVLSQLIIEFGFDTDTNVAAHIGGFVTGMLFVALLKLRPGLTTMSAIDDEQRQHELQKDIAKVQNLIVAMQFDEAKKMLLELQKNHPDNITIVQLLYVVARYTPASEEYHQLAHQLLGLTGQDKTTAKIIYDTFQDYASKAKPKPRWTPDLMVSIATRFAANGYLPEAETLMNSLINSLADFPRIPEGLLALAKYYKGKDKEKAQHYHDLLTEKYPGSAEANQLN